MNKEDLAQDISNTIGLSKANSIELVGRLFGNIAAAVARGEEVAVAGFGKFITKQRKATTAHNPQTREKIAVPAKTVVQFKPNKALAAAVNEVKEGGS